MRLLFSTLLLAASFERAAATVSVVDNYRDPVVVEGEEAAGVGGGFGKEERDLRGGKGGKGDKADKGGKAKNSKAHKANKYIGPGDCLATYQAIVSNRNYAYSGAGVCLHDIAVELTCESASKCSYAEHSLNPGSAYVMEACATFDPSKELVYDAGTGTCTLGADGIGLKRRQENSCGVPTAELSFKMTFDAMDSSGVHIDFSRNGGFHFYTEEEGNSTREAVPASTYIGTVEKQLGNQRPP